MNKLQAIDNDYPLFVTLNPVRMPDKALVHQTFSYDHPVFDTAAIAAQQRLPEIQGRDNIYWCGAWTANGFHEDGLKSAVAVMKTLGVTIPWASETDGYPKHGAGAIQQIKAG
jgi:predicted NAD/FAD-binding protein